MPEMTRRQLAARKLRAIPQAGGPAVATLLLHLLGPILAFVTWHVVNMRAGWRRATTLERALMGFACGLAVLAVWNFTWVMAAPVLYGRAYLFDTVVSLLCYPAWAWLMCRHVAESGRVRGALEATRVEYQRLLVRRMASQLATPVPSIRADTGPGVCVIHVGDSIVRFEYIDGEWRSA